MRRVCSAIIGIPWRATALELETPVAGWAKAGRRALVLARQPPLGTRQVPFLFARNWRAGLIRALYRRHRGGALYRPVCWIGLGTPVFPDFVTLRERPRFAQGQRAAPVRQRRWATADRDVVSDGALRVTCWILFGTPFGDANHWQRRRYPQSDRRGPGLLGQEELPRQLDTFVCDRIARPWGPIW